MFQTFTLDKSLLELMSLGQSGPLTNVPWTNVSTPRTQVAMKRTQYTLAFTTCARTSMHGSF